MAMGWRGWLGVGVAALALAGCSGVVTTLGELRDVGETVKRTVPCEDIGVKLWNGNRLEVQLVNMKPAPEGEAARKGKALEVARQAYGGYRAKETLSGVTVNLTERKRYLLLLSVDRSQTYVFRVEELQAPAAVGGSRPPGGG